LYESKGRSFNRDKKDYPVGLAPDDVARHRTNRDQAEQRVRPAGGGSHSVLRNSSDSNSVLRSSGGAGGGEGIPAAVAKPAKKAKAKKKPAADSNAKKKSDAAAGAVDESLVEALSRSSIAAAPELPPSTDQTAELRTRLKSLKKRLKEVTQLAERIKRGELKPDPEQRAKAQRQAELQAQIREVERQLGK